MRLLLILLIFSISINAELLGKGKNSSDKKESKILKLSLKKAITMALDNNLDIELERINPKVQEERLTGAWGIFDPVLEATSIYEDKDRRTNAVDASSLSLNLVTDPIFDEQNFRFEVSVSQKIATGGIIELRNSNDILRNTRNIDAANRHSPEYETTTELILNQPLLQGRGKDAVMAEILILQKDKDIAQNTFKAKANIIIADVMKAYSELVFADKNIQVKVDALDIAEKFLEENKRRLELKVMAPIDVVQAEAAISESKEDLISARSFRVERKNRLKTIISGNFSKLRVKKIKIDGSLKTDSPSLKWKNLHKKMIDSNPDLVNALLTVEQEVYRRRFAKNQSQMKLNLLGSVGYQGLSDDVFSSYDDFGNRNGANWTLGVVASMTFGARKAESRVREAILRERYAELNLKNVQSKLEAELDSAIDRVKAAKGRLKTTENSVKLAESALELEEKRLENGVTTSFNVLNLQKEVSDAQTRRLGAVVDLYQSLVNLNILTGELSNMHGIKINFDSI